MKEELDHIPEHITTFTIANSQQFYGIQIPRPSADNGGFASSVNTNVVVGGSDASGSNHERVGPDHLLKKTISKNTPAKGARCSSVATPKRRTRSTSQHEDLLSGPSRRPPLLDASQDSDDVVLEPMVKRPRQKVPARNDPKSSKSSLPSIQEDDDDELPVKINSRCIPKDVLEAIANLSEQQKARVCELGWEKFLQMAIDCVESRNLYLYLLDRVDTNSMCLRVPPNIELPLNKAAVHVVLGVPPGTEVLHKKSSKELSIAKRELMAQLGISANKITVPQLLEEVAKGNADDLSMKCFFLVIFNRFLFPGSSYDIANTDVQYIMDFENFGKVDWQQAVIDHIRNSAKEWQSPSAKNTTNPSIRSCAPFLLIYYLENLEHPLNDNNLRMVVPRAAVFSQQHISRLTNADRWADKDDRICYGKHQQKNPVGSAYQKVYTLHHTSVPASFQLPQLSHLLRGVLDNLEASWNPQLVQIVTAVDHDLRANQKHIHELHHANECLLIKFAEDVKTILGSYPSPTAPRQQDLTGQQSTRESNSHVFHGPALQHNGCDVGGPSHIEIETMRVDQTSAASQPLPGQWDPEDSIPQAVREEEIVELRDGQSPQQELSLTDLVGTPNNGNISATTNEVDVTTTEVGKTYTHSPTLPDEMIPKVGMFFDTEEHAYEMFRRYAEATGFPIKWYRKKPTVRDICCSMAGTWKYYKPDQQRTRNKFTKKTGCKVNMKLKDVFDLDGNNNGKVRIDKIRLDHNHPLSDTPRVTKQMRCHKKVEKPVMDYVDHLAEHNVPNTAVRSILGDMFGGEQNVPITRKDLDNRKAATTREQKADDIKKMVDYFRQCEEENGQFFWDFECDGEGIIQNLFWSHASMQGEFADFGDAVTFDTTYKTNVYNMPLAMFVGSNHHHQSTIFGVALLRQETIKTFEWLFSTFKRCMRGCKQLKCILTDEDQAMAQAIKSMFPGIIHRLCRWHVINKVQTQLTELDNLHKDFKDKLNSAINHPLTPQEFESAWSELLDEFSLHEDPTLQTLYRNRHDWVKAYFKKDYCGRMTSTQQSESMNMMVKNGLIDHTTCLHMFPKQIMRFIKHRNEDEAAKSYGDMSVNELHSQWGFVEQASRLYTHTVFWQFNDIVNKATRYHIYPDPNGVDGEFLVKHNLRTSKLSWGQHEFRIRIDKTREKYECECRTMEHTGLFCPHIIRGLMQSNIDKLPSDYFLRRLTRFARSELPFDRHDEKLQGTDGETQRQRHLSLTPEFMKALSESTMSAAGHKRAMHVIQELRKQLKTIPADIGPNKGSGSAPVTDADVLIGQTSSCSYGVPPGAAQPLDCLVGSSMPDVQGSVDLHTDNTRHAQLNLEKENECFTAGVKRKERYLNPIPPSRSNVKGDKSSRDEPIVLGAKGEKKCSRNCSFCGLATGHNRNSCPDNPKNAMRLAKLHQPPRKRGRPVGSEKSTAQKKYGNICRSFSDEFDSLSEGHSSYSSSYDSSSDSDFRNSSEHHG